jgi:tetratricopeptide (TPR) repeat protein
MPPVVNSPRVLELQQLYASQIQQRQYEAAQATAAEWLAAARELGHDQPAWMAAVSALARAHWFQRDAASADRVLRDALADYRAAGRHVHPAVARFHSELANMLESSDMAAAEREHREALRLCRQLYGDAAPQSCAAFIAWARAGGRLQMWSEAERELDIVVRAIAATSTTGAHTAAFDVQAKFGCLAKEQDQPLVALRHMEAARAVAESHGLSDSSVADILHLLGELYAGGRDFVRAAERFEAALARRRSSLGAEDSRTLVTQSKLAEAWRDTGRRQEAEQLLNQTIEQFRRTQGPDHLFTITAENALAALYVDAGRIGEAARIFERVLQAYEAGLGAEHEATRKVRDNLARVRRTLGSERP